MEEEKDYRSTYLISYDLLDSNSNEYNELFEHIKSYGTWARINESLWAIKTYKTAVKIRDEIMRIVPEGSSIFVIKSGVESAWNNVKCSNIWLRNYL
jgi:hypothetical protein